MNNHIIRKAETGDYETIIALIREFALFQQTPEKVSITADQLMASQNSFQALVAETGSGEIIGFASYFPAFFSWSGKALYLDDLYVTENYRRQGIGRQLLAAVIALAKDSGCQKVRWQVSGWNQNAIRFYKTIGAIIDSTEHNCDLLL